MKHIIPSLASHTPPLVHLLTPSQGTWRGLDVAIKRVIFQVLAGNSGDEMMRHTALREAAINATLDHPNIVPTYTYDMQPLGHHPKVSVMVAKRV